MNLRIGSQPRITAVTSAETETKPSTVKETTQEAAPLTSAANTSIRAESQLSATALYSQLNRQLLPVKEQSTPQLRYKNEDNQNLIHEKIAGKQDAKPWAYLPKTLSTGDGNDKVDISMGDDGRVHINVNGTEAWSGTLKQFQALTIDTGDGDDKVANTVDGANIITGNGDDLVISGANNVNISTGKGDDAVGVGGNNNYVNTGAGNDTVAASGDANTIYTESGDDSVRLSGSGRSSYVNTGYGEDYVANEANGSIIQTGGGNDSIQNFGSGVTIETGDGDDEVSNSGVDVVIDGQTINDPLH